MFLPFLVQIVRQSTTDVVTVVGSCVTLYEALKAADTLAQSNVNIRVIDPFTIKPIDGATILASARETGGKVITVEDHYAEGECLSLSQLYIHELPFLQLQK